MSQSMDALDEAKGPASFCEDGCSHLRKLSKILMSNPVFRFATTRFLTIAYFLGMLTFF